MQTEQLPARIPGVVCRVDRGSYLVWTGSDSLPCAAPCAQNPPQAAVGDRVRITRSGSGVGRIVEILPRRNRISRRAAGRDPGEQILAANVDQIGAVCAVGRRKPEWFLLDLFLALAETAGVPAHVLLSKADLLPESGAEAEEVRREAEEYRRIGYPVIISSSQTGSGIGAVRSILRGRTSLLIGKSGAGKSSLLNASFPEWELCVAAVSRFGEGRCTTSNARLYPLEDGGAVVDTPGMRTLEPWNDRDPGPAWYFREMRDLAVRCRFGAGCRHTEEPGCAVRRGVEAGLVSPRRFRSMLRLAGRRP